jgi:hypothetical protein
MKSHRVPLKTGLSDRDYRLVIAWSASWAGFPAEPQCSAGPWCIRKVRAPFTYGIVLRRLYFRAQFMNVACAAVQLKQRTIKIRADIRLHVLHCVVMCLFMIQELAEYIIFSCADAQAFRPRACAT